MGALRIVPALAAIVLAVSAIVLLAAPAEDCSAADGDPTELYPYADFIISDSGKSEVSVASRLPDGSGWEALTLPSGSSHVLAPLSSLSDTLTVVMTGGSLESLTLIGADVVEGAGPVDVRFEMLGGDLGELRVLSVDGDLAGELGDRYTFMFAPLGDVVLDLRSGHVEEVVPTADMVSVSSLGIEVSGGMSVDRLFVSGLNGRYDEISFVLTGGTVGYMTNVRSLVGDLSYELRLGTVEYLCIGADTEYGDNAALADLNTFLVQNDVSLTADTSVTVRHAVFGSGVVSTPSVLWNGTSISPPVASNVYVEAPGVTLAPDSCFMTSNRLNGTAYDLASYRIGGTPRTEPVSFSYAAPDGTERPVYGEGGVWASSKDMTVPTGHGLFLDAQLGVPASSTLTVMPGGLLVVSQSVVLYGTLDNRGTVVNNGMIEKREGGTFNGNEQVGDGYLAYCISLDAQGRIDVMASDDDTVLLRMERFVYVSDISALLDGGAMRVEITAPDTIYIGGDLFLISLRERETDGFEAAYELTIEGIDQSVLRYLDIAVTVPTPAYRDYYVYGSSDLSEPMETADGSRPGEITFYAVDTGLYVLSTQSPDGTEDPEPAREGMDDQTKNVILAVAIVIVGSVVVYILLRK